MAFKISDECISCGSCESECPNAAITEASDTYVIDPEKCTECVGFYDTQQCLDVCPVEAPGPDPEHREAREQLLAKFRKLNPGKEPVA
jgi:ferredoxin